MSNFIIDLENKIKNVISTWDESGIYAISFFVASNESFVCCELKNVPRFCISYNTESDCEGAGDLDEERWNYAFWRQDEVSIIDPYEPDLLTNSLFDWYLENGITNVGQEDEGSCYDENGLYIGKGPVGHYELLTIVSDIAKKLQTEGFIAAKFQKPIPIIIHGLEYAWYDIEATKKANPNGEADTFLKACEELGII